MRLILLVSICLVIINKLSEMEEGFADKSFFRGEKIYTSLSSLCNTLGFHTISVGPTEKCPPGMSPANPTQH